MGRKEEDFSAGEAPERLKSVANPSPKIGLLIRYYTGRKEEAIQEAFDIFGGPKGVVATVNACGQSRSWDDPEKFPRNNQFVSGKETLGYMFVKFEVLD